MARGARLGLKIIEKASSEPGSLGPVGSRTHPGKFGKYKSGALIPDGVLRDAVFHNNSKIGLWKVCATIIPVLS